MQSFVTIDYNAAIAFWKEKLANTRWDTQDWGICEIAKDLTFTTTGASRKGQLAICINDPNRLQFMSKHTSDPNCYYLKFINDQKLELRHNNTDALEEEWHINLD